MRHNHDAQITRSGVLTKGGGDCNQHECCCHKQSKDPGYMFHFLSPYKQIRKGDMSKNRRHPVSSCQHLLATNHQPSKHMLVTNMRSANRYCCTPSTLTTRPSR